MAMTKTHHYYLEVSVVQAGAVQGGNERDTIALSRYFC